MEITTEIDTSSVGGLTRLLRFAIRLREDPSDEAAINLIESRFGLEPYWPEFRGSLEDCSRKLDGLHPDHRFKTICKLISQVLQAEERLAEDLNDNILDIVSAARVVRFSFASSILVCLRFARLQKMNSSKRYGGYTIRYAGLSEDKALMACASLFLNLPIYTETGLPWDPDTILDDGDPNFEKPDYEISFPPAVVRLDDAYELEDSIRAQELPRAIDRGKYDIESVTVSHLSSCEWPATIGVTSDFLSSTKQSRLIARQRMLADQRISKVSHLNKAEPPKFFIELAKPGYMNDSINMSRSPDLRSPKDKKPFFSNARDVSYDEIRSAGHSLMPSRYMTKGPAGGNGIVEVIRNEFKEKKFNLSELFEVIRPKETKNAAEGTLEIQELRAGNITPNGEIEGRLRNVSIRATRMPSLDEQVVKAGDILLAHRGSIGHVAYITETDNTNIGLWAGQTLFILRERKLTSSSKSKIYCDPRVLFMYLLTPKVHEHWRSILTGDKNPSIPIGEVESLGLPENIVLPTKPRRGISPKNVKGASGYVEQVIFDFEKRQAMLLQVRELQKDMDDGLKRVWDTAWKKQIEKSDE